MTVSWFGPQNQVDFDLSVASQNQRSEVGAGHAIRSIALLHLEANDARISQPSLKTERGVTTGGARDIIVEVVSRGS
jgi:hypothetical protein